jgi:disulfide bond formation protein DsbB
MTDSRPSSPTVAALLAAVVSVAGSLYLSLGLKLIACPLCFYQRTFAFAVLGVLILGVFTRARETAYVNLMAFLPAVAGGLVAAFHTYLEAAGRLVCPKGIADIGSTAQQSLASFILILACLVPGLAIDIRRKGLSVAPVGWSLLLGGAFAYGCIVSSPAPSMPPPDKRPFICHPPESAEAKPLTPPA